MVAMWALLPIHTPPENAMSSQLLEDKGRREPNSHTKSYRLAERLG